MKTTVINTMILAGIMAVGTTCMAQDTTETDMQTNTMTTMDQQKVPKMMKKMDTNGDKMISMDEAKAAKNKKWSKNFKKADTSQDGMIDAKEFMAYQKNMKKMKGMKDKKMDRMKKKDSMDY